MSVAPEQKAGKRRATPPDDRLERWRAALTRAELAALLRTNLDEPGERHADEHGEAVLRAETLRRIEQALEEALVDDELILPWLRTRNAELHGDSPSL